MRHLTVEQLQAVQVIMDTVIPEAVAELDVTAEWMLALSERIKVFLVEDVRSRSPLPNFSLRLRSTGSGSGALSIERIRGSAAEGRGVFEVDGELRVLAVLDGGVTLPDASQRTRQLGGVEVFVEGLRALFLVKGCVVRELNLHDPGAPVYPGAPTRYAMNRFPSMVEDHYHEVLRGERGESYWKNKAKRVLMSAPEKTEYIFQRSLMRWLNLNVYDRLRVYAEPSGLGQDKTDIMVVTTAGPYVIEIKWLGVNENNTIYDKDRIESGLRQVGIYLDNDPELIRGFLVCYDGRAWDVHRSAQDYDPNCLHDACEKPVVQFLESENPSALADAGSGARRRR